MRPLQPPRTEEEWDLVIRREEEHDSRVPFDRTPCYLCGEMDHRTYNCRKYGSEAERRRRLLEIGVCSACGLHTQPGKGKLQCDKYIAHPTTNKLCPRYCRAPQCVGGDPHAEVLCKYLARPAQQK